MVVTVATVIVAVGVLAFAFGRFGADLYTPGTLWPVVATVACAVTWLLVRSTFGATAGWVFIAVAVAALWNLPLVILNAYTAAVARRHSRPGGERAHSPAAAQN